MRIFRNQEHWQALIEDQKLSGLSIIDYCHQNQLSTSSFYAARHKTASLSNAFVRTKVTQEVEVSATTLPIELLIGAAKIILPSTTSATYIGQLLRELT
jgi:hypothetical protein